MRIKLLQNLIRLLDLLDRVLPKGEIEWDYGGRVYLVFVLLSK